MLGITARRTSSTHTNNRCRRRASASLDAGRPTPTQPSGRALCASDPTSAGRATKLPSDASARERQQRQQQRAGGPTRGGARRGGGRRALQQPGERGEGAPRRQAGQGVGGHANQGVAEVRRYGRAWIGTGRSPPWRCSARPAPTSAAPAPARRGQGDERDGDTLPGWGRGGAAVGVAGARGEGVGIDAARLRHHATASRPSRPLQILQLAARRTYPRMQEGAHAVEIPVVI